MTPASARPTTIDEYLDGLEDPARTLIARLRALVQEALPAATEAVKWGSPAHLHPSGTILLVYSAHKDHANFVVTPSTREAFDRELEGFATGKGRVALPYGKEIPEDLLRRMIAYRLREHAEEGVGWM